MRLIDADALKKAVEEFPNCYNGWSDAYDKSFIIGAIEEQPSIDIVRCGECKWCLIEDGGCERIGMVLFADEIENHFCGYGERRE